MYERQEGYTRCDVHSNKGKDAPKSCADFRHLSYWMISSAAQYVATPAMVSATYVGRANSRRLVGGLSYRHA